MEFYFNFFVLSGVIKSMTHEPQKAGERVSDDRWRLILSDKGFGDVLAFMYGRDRGLKVGHHVVVRGTIRSPKGAGNTFFVINDAATVGSDPDAESELNSDP